MHDFLHRYRHLDYSVIRSKNILRFDLVFCTKRELVYEEQILPNQKTEQYCESNAHALSTNAVELKPEFPQELDNSYKFAFS